MLTMIEMTKMDFSLSAPTQQTLFNHQGESITHSSLLCTWAFSSSLFLFLIVVVVVVVVHCRNCHVPIKK